MQDNICPEIVETPKLTEIEMIKIFKRRLASRKISVKAGSWQREFSLKDNPKIKIELNHRERYYEMGKRDCTLMNVRIFADIYPRKTLCFRNFNIVSGDYKGLITKIKWVSQFLQVHNKQQELMLAVENFGTEKIQTLLRGLGFKREFGTDMFNKKIGFIEICAFATKTGELIVDIEGRANLEEVLPQIKALVKS